MIDVKKIALTSCGKIVNARSISPSTTLCPGGGDSHMKQTGMLVVSLRGVNFGFWSRLGCSGQSAVH